MKPEITDRISEEDRDRIRSGLVAYNIPRFEDLNVKELGVYYREDGVLLAGLTGETHGDWLEIDFLWVTETLRRQGIGSRLLDAAENEARNRGCKHSFLNTFDFQAPGFYEKKGYREVFTLNDFPKTGKKRFLIKEL